MSKCGICVGVQASAGLTGVTTSFLGLPSVRGLCPTCGDNQPWAGGLLWVISLHAAPPLTCSSDVEPVKLLFQVAGGAESTAGGMWPSVRPSGAWPWWLCSHSSVSWFRGSRSG